MSKSPASSHETGDPPTQGRSAKPKGRYCAPRLHKYGSVAKLTQGASAGPTADGQSNMFMATGCL